MRIITGPRRGGKTYRLVKMFKERPGVLVVPTSHQKLWIQDTYGIPDQQVILAAPNALRGLQQWAYVDNIDMLLDMMLGGGIAAGTTTGSCQSVSWDPCLDVDDVF